MSSASLTDTDIDPFAIFKDWLLAAEASELNDPNAIALATSGEGGMPSVRMVLLKSFDEKGFVFMTNKESYKGDQLKKNPKAAFCMHWKSLRRQVRTEGLITHISEEESDAYFATRSRGSQVGAWASQQSRPLPERKALETAAKEVEKKFADQAIPRPPFWGGFRLTPLRIEFWQDGAFRLHERKLFKRTSLNGAWRSEMLYP